MIRRGEPRAAGPRLPSRLRLRWALLGAVLLAPLAAPAQTTTLFDEDDGGDAAVYEASTGASSGGDALDLAGGSMPLTDAAAQSGAQSGVVAYTHVEGGAWSLLVGAPGFASLDASGADSLVLFLNGPSGVPGVSLPSVALEDADGNRSAALPLDFRTLVGFSRTGSGFLPGSPTDAAFSVTYQDVVPADRARPGYPETIEITFADTPLDTSRAAIGVPAVPAHFTVATAGGMPLEFQFRDTDGDGTLSASGEYIAVLTPEAAGSARLVPTWRITLSGSTASPPGAGDVYRLAVFNSGVDGDAATWQRRSVPISAFGPLGDLDLGRLRGVRLSNPTPPTAERVLWIDGVALVEDAAAPVGVAPPTGLDAEAGDETVLLRWTPAEGATGVVVFRKRGGDPFERLTDRTVRQDYFFDLDAENGVTYTYVLRSTSGIQNLEGPDSAPIEAAAAEGAGDPYIDTTARLAFDYFWQEANPANGLVKDRSRESSAASIAAVGFGLSAYTVGADRGWVTREQAADRTRATLEFFAACPQSDATSGVCGYKGFFYHFLNMSTGERAGTNELSTIDTALLLGGVLHAAQYYDADDADEARIRELADAIWRRVDWAWAAPRSPLVALGWRPESGFIGFDWRGYNEAMILYVLGLGSPTHPLPDGAWDAWTASYGPDWQTHYGIEYLTFPPLFGHQYSHVWVDFRDIQDDYMRAKSVETGDAIDYFENSRRATRASRAYAIANPGRYPNYSADEWGLTASDDPFGYRAHGAPPAQSDNGTITPTAAGGSYAFTPELSRQALRTFYARYRAGLWGRYGLRDAYNVAEGWFATDVLGIDQGPIVLMIENERTGAIWESFMTHPDVQRGLDRAGFRATPIDAEDTDVAALELSRPAPNPSSGTVRLALTLPAPADVRLSILDVLGREVAVLSEGRRSSGSHVAEWDARAAAPGVYLVRLVADGSVRTQPLVVAR